MTAAKAGVTRDQQLIISLLCGPYLKDGSTEELEARRALARLLRTSRPLNLSIRYVLADLIDPDQDVVNRRILFENRRKGKPSDAAGENEIAEFIWYQIQAGTKREAVFSEAGKRFGLKRARILKIWGEWQPILRRRHRSNPLTLSDWTQD